jgi:hypothetical protein
MSACELNEQRTTEDRIYTALYSRAVLAQENGDYNRSVYFYEYLIERRFNTDQIVEKYTDLIIKENITIGANSALQRLKVVDFEKNNTLERICNKLHENGYAIVPCEKL